MESRNLSQPPGTQPGVGGKSGSAPRPELLSINELARCCSEETNKFLKQSVSNDRFCLEMFRRAIVNRDDDAWTSIYQHSLAAILKYLKMCVHSVVADEVRSRQSRQYEETLELIEQEPAGDDPADDVVSNISAQGLWQVIQEELNGEDERVLIYLAYIHGMKPSEISSQHRRLFPTVDDVYRIKRNVLERLRRNRRLQLMFKFQ